MIDLLQRLLRTRPTALPDPGAHLALAALLVRVARVDGVYSADEQGRITTALCHQFTLSGAEATALRLRAEEFEAAAPDTVRFTRAIKDAVPLDQRAAVMQVLWQVALADGTRHADEDALLRLVASLLGLSDVASAQARQKAALP